MACGTQGEELPGSFRKCHLKSTKCPVLYVYPTLTLLLECKCCGWRFSSDHGVDEDKQPKCQMMTELLNQPVCLLL